MTHVLAPSASSIPVPVEKIEKLGIKVYKPELLPTMPFLDVLKIGMYYCQVLKLESTLLEDAHAEKEAKCIFKSACLIDSLSTLISENR